MRRFACFLQRSLVISVCVLAGALNLAAATLDNYRQRIEAAHLDTNMLLDVTREDSLVTRDVAAENERIAGIRRLLPTTETVDSSSGSVETSNQWLHSALDAFTKENDAKRRRIIISAALERLASIAREVDQLQKAEAAARTKDEDKQKLGEILKREEYQKAETPEDSLFQRWWKKFVEWLESVFPRPSTAPQVQYPGFGGLAFLLQILLLVAAVGLIGFLIYRFAPGLFGRYGGSPKTKKVDRVILGERISADESATDLFSDAERLARDGDLRGAIRKGYIALLCELSDRKVIGLARHKTNRDYVRDVRKRTDLVEGMTGMTRSFEQNWYGLRTAGAADWEDFRETYQKTITRV